MHPGWLTIGYDLNLLGDQPEAIKNNKYAERLAAGETRAIETLQKGFRAYCKVPTVARERVRAALNVDPHFDVIVTCKNS